ncbi:MAG: hypothetical protein WCG26_05160 [Chloroflexales bacterium]
MRLRTYLSVFGLALALLFWANTPEAAHAAACTWTGAAADNDWQTAGNWSGCGGVPGAADTVTLAGTATGEFCSIGGVVPPANEVHERRRGGQIAGHGAQDGWYTGRRSPFSVP